jgi:hypothetical protein
LRENADVSSVDHLRLEQFKVRDVGIGTLELDDFTDLCHFLGDERRVHITVSVHQSKNTDGVFPTVLLSKPSRRFWKEEHGSEQENGWDHLQSPWYSESTSSVDKRAAVADVEHDQDSPSDSP